MITKGLHKLFSRLQKCISIIGVLILLTTYASAQNIGINYDLLHTSKDTTLTDSTRFQAINKCYAEYSYAVPDSMLPLIEYHKVLGMAKGDKGEVCKSLNEKAFVFYLKGESERAMGFLYESLDILIAMNDSLNIGKQHNNIASIFDQQKDYLKALKNYHASLTYFETQPDKTFSLAIIYNNIGLIYYNIDELDYALENLNKAIDLFERSKTNENYGDTWTAIASINMKKKNYAKAIEYGRRGLGFLDSGNNMRYLADNYSLFANTYYELEKADSAMVYAKKMLEVFEGISNEQEVLNSELLIAKILAKTDLGQAVTEGERIVSSIKPHYVVGLKTRAYEHLYKSYKVQGKSAKSLEMHEQYVIYNDSLQIEKNKLNVIREAIERDSKLEMAAIKSENQKTQVALKSESQWKIFGLLGLGFLASVLGLFLFRKRNTANEKQRALLIAEIDQLKISKETQTIPVAAAEFKLDESKIKASIGRDLNETDWTVLRILLDDPVISNKDLAAKAYKSVDGIGSSLRRMYTYFDIKESKYKKISLLMEAIKISNKI